MHYKIFVKPSCSYCTQAFKLLNEKKAKYVIHSVERQAAYVLEIKQKYNWMTMPVILQIDEAGTEKLIGGYTELYKHFHKTEKNNV